MPYNTTDVLCINLDNKSGALASVAEKLAKTISIFPMRMSPPAQKAAKRPGVLKVADVKKAMQVLEKDHGIKVGKSQPLVRRRNLQESKQAA